MDMINLWLRSSVPGNNSSYVWCLMRVYREMSMPSTVGALILVKMATALYLFTQREYCWKVKRVCRQHIRSRRHLLEALV